MTLTFARFDLLSWALQRQPLLPLALVAAVGFALPVPGLAIVAAGLVTSVTVAVPFLADERGRLDALYGILPVSRRAVVAGRTLSLLVYSLAAAAIATIVTYIAAAFQGEAVPHDVVLMALAAAAAIVGLSLALQLPVLFRVGYSRGRFIAYAPSMTLAGLAWIAQAVGATDLLPTSDHPPVAIICAAGLLFGVAGAVIGASFAVRAYRRRSL